MNILFVLNIDIACFGPSVHLLKDIICEIATDKKNQITILSKMTRPHNEKSFNDFRDYENITVVDVESKQEKRRWIKRYLQEVAYTYKCRRAARNLHPDIVFLQSCNVAYFQMRWIKKYYKAKTVYNVQDIFPYNLHLANKLPLDSILFPVFRYLQRKAYLLSDEIITISRDMEQLLKQETNYTVPVVTIHNWGYDDSCGEEPFCENKFARNYSISQENFNVMYAGNIGVVQNVELIIRAAELLTEDDKIKFYFVGQGAYKERLEQYAIQKNLNNVVFLPMQNESMAPYVYSAADVNIVPLAKNVIKTALPSKIPACLASGRQLIACIEKDSELSKILSNTDGCYVVSNCDERELSELLIKLSKEERRNFINRQEALGIFSKVNNPKLYMREFIKITETISNY